MILRRDDLAAPLHLGQCIIFTPFVPKFRTGVSSADGVGFDISEFAMVLGALPSRRRPSPMEAR
jgi:hypothetical protein